MPRFFLHLFDGELTADPEGFDAGSADGAILWASQVALAMAAVAVRETAQLNCDHYVVLADESGSELARIYFGEVVAVSGVRLNPDQGRN